MIIDRHSIKSRENQVYPKNQLKFSSFFIPTSLRSFSLTLTTGLTTWGLAAAATPALATRENDLFWVVDCKACLRAREVEVRRDILSGSFVGGKRGKKRGIWDGIG